MCLVNNRWWVKCLRSCHPCRKPYWILGLDLAQPWYFSAIWEMNQKRYLFVSQINEWIWKSSSCPYLFPSYCLGTSQQSYVHRINQKVLFKDYLTRRCTETAEHHINHLCGFRILIFSFIEGLCDCLVELVYFQVTLGCWHCETVKLLYPIKALVWVPIALFPILLAA